MADVSDAKGKPDREESEIHDAATMDSSGKIATPPDFPASEWDRYKYVSLLGEGGMGRVYRMLDPRLNRPVAVKFLKSESAGQIQRFLREARAQAQIEHDNVCKIYEAGEVEGLQYIVMQFIDGRTLSRTREDLTLEQKVRLMRQVCEGIHEAHRMGLIHRDIKPGNIMVEKRESGWHPYVLDFGLVRDAASQDVTMTGAILGTPGYMAPEQAWGKIDQLDRRVDVYGLGATLYFLLGGKSPVDSVSTMDALRKLLQEEPDPLRKVSPGVPADLETIVMKCLEKEPNRRYPSARALAEELQRYLDGDPIQARPASLADRLLKKARKNRALVAVSAVALILVLVAGGFAVQASLQARRQSELAQEFGRQVQGMEAILRIGHTIPLHDTRGETQMIREQMDQIRKRMQDLGPAAHGPGHYALGRGFLSLNQPDAAAKELQLAWDGGYRAPEVGCSLGLALGQLYEHELETVEAIRNKDVREARRKEIETKYRDPALVYLKEGRSARIVSSDYVEGLILFYEKKYDEALKKASEASRKLPWIYEAYLLTAQVYTAIGNERRASGNTEGAMDAYNDVQSAYKMAVRIGESDPEAYEGLCSLWINVMYLRVYSTGGDLKPDLDKAVAACDSALQAEPDREAVFVRKANAYWLYANAQDLAGEDPSESLQKSIKSGNDAIRLNPRDPLAYKNLATAYQLVGNQENHKNKDPRPSLRLAVNNYGKALTLKPDDIATYNSLGNTYAIEGDYLRDKGQDPSPSYLASIDTFKSGIEIDSRFAYIHSNLGVTHKDLAWYEEQHGISPEQHLNLAVASYKKCLDLKPDDSLAHNNLGNGYKALARYYLLTGRDPHSYLDPAIEVLTRVIQTNPTYGSPYSNLGEVYRIRGEYAFATGKDPLPDWNTAIATLQKGHEVKKGDAGFLDDMATVHLDFARYELFRGEEPVSARRVRELEEQALAIDPERESALQRVGESWLIEAESLLKRGKSATAPLRKAEDALQKALTSNTQNTFVLRDLADRLLLAAQDARQLEAKRAAIAEGIAAADRVLAINPKMADALAIRGQLYLLQWKLDGTADSRGKSKDSLSAALALNANLSRLYAPILAQVK
jgi:serine/threonine-protein kinase